MTTGVARRPDDSRRRNGHVCEITDRTRRPTVLRRRSGEQGRGGDRLPRVHLGTQALRTGPMADADARGAYAPGPLASSACSRSRQRSSTCSQPTLTRRRSSGTTWRSEGGGRRAARRWTSCASAGSATAASDGDGFRRFVARQARLAVDRAERGMLGARYKTAHDIVEDLLASRGFREGAARARATPRR